MSAPSIVAILEPNINIAPGTLSIIALTAANVMPGTTSVAAFYEKSGQTFSPVIVNVWPSDLGLSWVVAVVLSSPNPGGPPDDDPEMTVVVTNTTTNQSSQPVTTPTTTYDNPGQGVGI